MKTARQIDKVLLISSVQSRPWLYNTHHPSYKDCVKRFSTWEEIGKIVDAPADVTRKAWNAVRERYTKIRSRVVADLPKDCSAEDAAVLRKGKWKPYHLLDTFLRKHYNPRRQDGQRSDVTKARGVAQPLQDVPVIFESPDEMSREEERDVKFLQSVSTIPLPLGSSQQVHQDAPDEHDTFGQLVAGRLRQMSELDAHRAQLK